MAPDVAVEVTPNGMGGKELEEKEARDTEIAVDFSAGKLDLKDASFHIVADGAQAGRRNVKTTHIEKSFPRHKMDAIRYKAAIK